MRFDEPGKPLTAALPYGETPWVRITAASDRDGSAGVQFGITDLAVTQYDATGYAHPVNLRHTVEVPGPPPGSRGRAVGSGLGTAGPAGLRRGSRRRALRLAAVAGPRGAGEPEPDVDRAGTDFGDADGVGAARQGPALADLVRQPGTTRADGDSDSFDVLGTAFAAADGDPRTAWTAPQGVVQHRAAPTLTLTLPEPTEVAALRLTPSASALPTHPTLVAVDLGDGPQVRAHRTPMGPKPFRCTRG